MGLLRLEQSELNLLVINTRRINTCRACNGLKLEIVWQLADSPYGDLYKKTYDEAININFESLTLALCQDCKMLQLLEVIDINLTYDKYLYRSSITNNLSSYYSQVAHRLISDYYNYPKGLVLDIGSNDGTFLSNFLNTGFSVLGIEPTKNNANIAESIGVPTINSYFNESTASYILEKFGHPNLISINYTLANIDNLLIFMKNVKSLMDENTILSIITGYHPDQYAINMFEYINHDHLTYLTVESFGNLCKSINLKIIDVSKSEHKGGSIQFVVSKEQASFQVQGSVKQILQREIWLDANCEQFTKNLASQIQVTKIMLNTLMVEEGITEFYGIGASISSTYLCNQFELNNKIIELFDDDVNKIGRFSPGYGIHVQALSGISKLKSKPALLLAWQHSEKLISRLSEVGFRGSLITPLPFPKLIIK